MMFAYLHSILVTLNISRFRLCSISPSFCGRRQFSVPDFVKEGSVELWDLEYLPQISVWGWGLTLFPYKKYFVK